MILISKKDDTYYFRIWFLYWIGSFRVLVVNQLLSTDDWSRSQVRDIQKEIKKNLGKKYR